MKRPGLYKNSTLRPWIRDSNAGRFMTEEGRVASYWQFLFHCSYRGKETSKNPWLERFYDNRVTTGLLRYKPDFMETGSRRGLPSGILESLWVAISRLGTVCGKASIISHISFWKVCLHAPSCQACLCSQQHGCHTKTGLWAPVALQSPLPRLNTNPWLLASILFVGSLYHLCLENQYYVPQKTWWEGTWFTWVQKLNSGT